MLKTARAAAVDSDDGERYEVVNGIRKEKSISRRVCA
jgi:hypothetical protein